jgi:hypothetical protein
MFIEYIKKKLKAKFIISGLIFFMPEVEFKSSLISYRGEQNLLMRHAHIKLYNNQFILAIQRIHFSTKYIVGMLAHNGTRPLIKQI